MTARSTHIIHTYLSEARDQASQGKSGMSCCYQATLSRMVALHQGRPRSTDCRPNGEGSSMILIEVLSRDRHPSSGGLAARRLNVRRLRWPPREQPVVSR